MTVLAKTRNRRGVEPDWEPEGLLVLQGASLSLLPLISPVP
jgi:hypothetical protein